MSASAIDDLPIVCTLTDTQRDERRRGISEMLATADGREELDRGYRFRFPGSSDIAAELLGIIVFERECCRFFSFNLSFEPDLGAIWFSIEGPEGVKEFLRNVEST